MVAGEASGDLHGANLVRAIRELSPRAEFCGIGGERMEEAGVEILFPSSEMAVVGLTEVFSRIRVIARAYLQIEIPPEVAETGPPHPHRLPGLQSPPRRARQRNSVSPCSTTSAPRCGPGARDG